MLRDKSLLCSAFLTAILLASPVAGEERVRFIEPPVGAVLIGPTDFEFAVIDGDPAVERIDVYIKGRLVGSALAPEWSFIWDAPSDVGGEAVYAVAFGADGLISKTRLETMDIGFGNEIQINVVQLYPVVVDRRGRFIRELAKKDFTVLDQGKVVDIETFATEATSLSIALVLDISGSMFDQLGLVQDASCGFVEQLRPEDEVSLYAFNQALRRVVPPTQDRTLVGNGVRSLVARGGTALYDAMMRVLGDLQNIPGRRAVFLFSDGMDERSVATLQQVVRAARKSEAIIYAVGSGKDKDTIEARDDLVVLAEETGGEAHFIGRLKELPKVFDSVLTHLRAQYVLSYPMPEGPLGLRRLEVRVANRKYKARCRSSYVAE